MSAYAVIADIGTGTVKAEAYSESGEMLAREVGRYRIADERSDEIDPEVWFEAFLTAVRGINRSTDLGSARYLAFAGQMQDLILVRGRRAMRNALLYYAHRSTLSYERWLSSIGEKRIIDLTGNAPDQAGFPAKLFWIAENDPAVLGETEALLCGAHDYVAYRLTGRARTDRTTASTTGLMDPFLDRWSDEIVEGLPVRREILPEICRGNESDGRVRPDVASELGFPSELEVVHGVGDVGANILAMENAGFTHSCYLGTSGWVQNTGSPDEPGDPRRGVFNLRHPITERLIRVAPILTATGAFEWFLGLLSETGDARDRLYRELPHETVAIAPDECRVVFLPYLSGERSPFKDPHASGVFLGLRRGSERTELFRAIEEGIAFSLRSVLESLHSGADESGGRTAPIVLSGGGAAIVGLPAIIAEVTRRTIVVEEDARFAGTRALLSLVPGIAPLGRTVGRSFVPQCARDVYAEKYALFRDAYTKNKELMYALSQIG